MSANQRFLQDYLTRMADIHGTGGAVKETSYYSALENLLNATGDGLDPKVMCNGQLREQGAGHPDFGLYTKDQIKRGKIEVGQIPERGVIEVKGLDDNTWQTCKGKQASKYFDRYRHVLVTNYRDFRLIVPDSSGRPVESEFYSLAADAKGFWEAAAHPAKTAKTHAPRFDEFLSRVLMAAAPLARAEDVAWFLASYAREALAVLEQAPAEPLGPLRNALEHALGITFSGKDGEHFFRSTLVQTLFYGVFSAWVNQVREGVARFDWRTAGYSLHVPTINALFSEIAKPTRLKPLKIDFILDRTAKTLNQVDRDSFFKTFDTGEAIQHFYEPFLMHFDPELRKQLGVWYTPTEVVRYMVERVDRALKTELGVTDGFADKNVFVLDPCCGTGAYLLEVLRKIESNLRLKGAADALLADDVKEAALSRVFGFEIMSAPYVIAHWQVGTFLASIHAAIDEGTSERPAIYLTNSLTGWEPPQGEHKMIPLFPELEKERDAAEHVKRDVPILVILGNPPYNAYAGTSPNEEQGLVEPYKAGLIDVWKIRKFNLDDLYVRFLRIAERRIAATGRGIFSYISNYSYLGDASFVVARQKLLHEFDDIWIDCMNGDSRETGKLTPSGDPDPSVFSTPFNREGIRLGTAIGLFVRRSQRSSQPRVLYRDFWGVNKRQALLDSLNNSDSQSTYQSARPNAANRYSFRPQDVSTAYLSWPTPLEFAAIEPISGLQEMRRGSLMDIDRDKLENRVQRYFDSSIAWDEIVRSGSGPTNDAGGFNAKSQRAALLKKSVFDATNLRRYALFPLDNRWAYWSPISSLWNRPRPDLVQHIFPGNRSFIIRMAAERPHENIPATITPALPDYHLLRPNVVAIPMRLAPPSEINGAGGLLAAMHDGKTKANLSALARQYLKALSLPDPDKDLHTGEALWLHSLAICSSPLYLVENRDGVQANFPRVPLPNDASHLIVSANLGQRVTALLDPDHEVPGITTGDVGDFFALLGPVASINANNMRASDLVLTVGWGRADSNGTVMPGKGKTCERPDYGKDEAGVRRGLVSMGKDPAQCLSLLGTPIDVFLNDSVYWSTVPSAVWELRIGGYQVLKKWLSYREQAVICRPLRKEEVREFTSLVRRLAALVLMCPELDVNYQNCRNNSFDWQQNAA